MSIYKYPSDKRRCRISIRLEHAIILHRIINEKLKTNLDIETYDALLRICDLIKPHINKALSYVEERHERQSKLIREMKEGMGRN